MVRVKGVGVVKVRVRILREVYKGMGVVYGGGRG